MATQLEASNSTGLDVVKWVVVVTLLVAATLGNNYLADVSAVLRVGGMLLVGVVALAVALTTTKGRALLEMLSEARIEARKIVWPSRQETWQTTMIVAAVVIATALLLWGIDSFFGWAVSSIIG
jgi:preprotein translocase subunit SecE